MSQFSTMKTNSSLLVRRQKTPSSGVGLRMRNHPHAHSANIRGLIVE